MRGFKIVIAGVLLLLTCCISKYEDRNVVFKNDFESNGLEQISNAKVESFQGNRVLGRYSSGGFILDLDKLESHQMIEISMDLYIHDTWDGNRSKPDGPDIWIMDIDGQNAYYSTFANGLCEQTGGCQMQSYPDYGMPFNNHPANSNATRTDLPGACSLKDKKGGTVMYRIVRTFGHSATTLKLGCFAQLEHGSSTDPDCDESWSVDNLKITTIGFK